MKFKMQKPACLIIILMMVVTLIAGCGAANGSMPKDNGDIDGALGASKALTAVNQLVADQHDKYAAYYTKDEYQALIDDIVGVYSGIGVYIFEEESGDVIVSGVMKNGPAYKAGLQPGDIIAKINGADATEKTSEEVSKWFKSQPIGKTVKLTVIRDGNPLTLDVVPDNVDVPTLTGKILTAADNSQIGLIKIYSFNSTTGQQFADELNEMMKKNISGLIIDLRDNGGGEVMSSLQICDLFVPKGKALMYVTDSTGTFSYEAAVDPINIPMVALQNENTASASEILLGAIQDNQAGKTIGTTSYGKGLVQNVIPLESGAGLKTTTSKYSTSGERDINKIGIKPDIEYPMPEGVDIYASLSMEPKDDPQLVRAIEVLETEKTAKATAK